MIPKEVQEKMENGSRSYGLNVSKQDFISIAEYGYDLRDNEERWIPVEEGLPELETKVIVARPNQYSGKTDILMAYLHDSGEKGRSCGTIHQPDWLYGKYWSFPTVSKMESVTHWQPLPKPPNT